MKVDYVEESTVRKTLSFEIEPDVVGAEIDKRVRDYARKVRLKGFRPGKVPPRVVKDRFRKEILDDVAEAIVNKVVFQELEGRGLKPVDTPRVTELEIAEGSPMKFRAVFETLPPIELPEWRGLSAKAPAVEVKDEDVERELKALQEGAATYEPVEGRPLQKGDFAVVDVTRTPQDGGKVQRNEQAVLEVGGEDQPPEINEALEGMAVDETRTATVAPKIEEESGATAPGAEYTLVLKQVKRKVLPEIDDELARDVGEFDSLDELKQAIRTRLQSAADHEADRNVKRELVDALVAKADFELPQALVERHMTARTENAARGLAAQGIDPRQVGIDWREYRDKQREDAEKNARADLLLDEIARREGIEALDAEIDAEVSRLATRMKKSKEALRAQLEKEGDMSALRARIREDKVLDLIKANARLARG